MTVIVDSREPSHIKDLATEYFPDIQVKQLPVGDLVCEERGVVWERKTIQDLIGSVLGDGEESGRLFEQAYNMYSNFPHRYLLIIGDYGNLDSQDKDRFSQAMYRGVVMSLRCRYGIHVWNVPTNRAFFEDCKTVLDKSDGDLKLDRVLRFKRSKGDVLSGMVAFCVEGIGPENARRIIEHCKVGEVRDLCDLKLESLMEVPGIGEKRGLSVKEYFK